MKKLSLLVLVILTFIQCNNISENISKEKRHKEQTQRIKLKNEVKKVNDKNYSDLLKGAIVKISNSQNKENNNDLNNILNEINNSNEKEQIIKDTSIIELAKYYKLDSVVLQLQKIGFKKIEKIPNSIKQSVPENKIDKIKVFVKISKDGEIIDNRFYKLTYFEKHPFNDNRIFNPYGWCNYFYSYDHKPYEYKNKYFLILSDFSSEFSSHIFTIWKKNDTIFTLDNILKEQIKVGMGRVMIDTIVEVQKKDILVCRIMAGDGGYYDGTLLFAKLEKQRNLNFLYWVNWSGEIENQRTLSYSVNKNIVNIKISNVKYIESNNKRIKKDSIVEQEIILNIDTILMNNRNIEFRKKYY